MFIRVERGSSVPISRQIAEQIRAQCLSGVLPPGACLPSVRQLSRQLAVNVNTVVRVYERLSADKLVEMRHGDGTYVLPRNGVSATFPEMIEQREQYARDFDAVVRRGLMLGLTARDLRSMLTADVSAVKSEIGKLGSETDTSQIRNADLRRAR